MTTSQPNESPDEQTTAVTAHAEPEGGGETEERTETSAGSAERILTASTGSGRPAVPSAMTEPEPEPSQAGRHEEPDADEVTSPETDPAARTADDLEASGSTDPSAATSGAAASAADTSSAASDTSASAGDTSAGSVTGDSAVTAVAVAPGRPHKSLLAGAAIAGALLISVPFLISGGDGDDARSSEKPGATPGTVLEGLAAGPASGVVGSQSPSPHPSKKQRKTAPKVVTSTGPDGKPVRVTVAPETGTSGGGKKSSGGEKKTSTEESGSGGAGSGSTSGDSSSDSGSTSSDKTDSAPSEPWPGGVQIYSHASNHCIGVANSPGAPTGSALVIWDCYDVSYQRWKFVSGTVQSEGKCMNVSGGATGNGALINWTTCNGSAAQQFRLNSSHDLTNPNSGNKCVDVKDQQTSNGARLQLWTCAGTPNQKWSTRTP